MEYCVQYRETDFNFISRLMEQNGIFYFFQHETGKHTMVIADSSSAHEACPGQTNAGYNLVSGGLDEADVINSWSVEQELRSGKYTLTDYNFTDPIDQPAGTEPTIVIRWEATTSFEIFDYPGDYTTRADGTAFAKLRMQEEEAGHLVANGSSVCRAFTTGYKFDLTDHYQAAMNISYVLTEIQHIASVADSYGRTGGSGDSYSNHFTCIPETVPFRPARLTPKPFVQGPQTAVVIGKSPVFRHQRRRWRGRRRRDLGGQLRPGDRSLSLGPRRQLFLPRPCFAGLGWAGLGLRSPFPALARRLSSASLKATLTARSSPAAFTTRIRPCPMPLPDNQTRSTFKTRSSKGGGADNYNELRFEDKTGRSRFSSAERRTSIPG